MLHIVLQPASRGIKAVGAYMFFSVIVLKVYFDMWKTNPIAACNILKHVAN